MPSDASTLLRTAVDAHLVPIAQPIGMSVVANLGGVRPGLVACTLGRPLLAGTVLVWQVWCQGKTRHGLTWRLDVKDGELWRDVPVLFPFEREGFPPARPSGGSHHELGDFHGDRSPEVFHRAIECLGAIFVARATDIVRFVPELAAPVESATSTPAWQAAVRSGPRLWAHRFVTGDIDPTEIPGTIAFVGQNLVTIEAGGQRVSFKFPVQNVSKSDQAHVSGWWTTPAGTRAATVLRIGDRTWRFEPSGKLIATPRG